MRSSCEEITDLVLTNFHRTVIAAAADLLLSQYVLVGDLIVLMAVCV